MENILKSYDFLAHAIIEQAALDYLELKRQIDQYPRTVWLKRDLKRIQDFFTSDWFTILSDMDGEALIKQLDKTFEKWKLEELKKVE